MQQLQNDYLQVAKRLAPSKSSRALIGANPQLDTPAKWANAAEDEINGRLTHANRNAIVGTMVEVQKLAQRDTLNQSLLTIAQHVAPPRVDSVELNFQQEVAELLELKDPQYFQPADVEFKGSSNLKSLVNFHVVAKLFTKQWPALVRQEYLSQVLDRLRSILPEREFDELRMITPGQILKAYVLDLTTTLWQTAIKIQTVLVPNSNVTPGVNFLDNTEKVCLLNVLEGSSALNSLEGALESRFGYFANYTVRLTLQQDGLRFFALQDSVQLYSIAMLLYLKEHDSWANGERFDASLTQFSNFELTTEEWRRTITRAFHYFIKLQRSGLTVGEFGQPNVGIQGWTLPPDTKISGLRESSNLKAALASGFVEVAAGREVAPDGFEAALTRLEAATRVPLLQWIQTHHPELQCTSYDNLRPVTNDSRQGLRRSFSIKQYIFESCPAAAMIDQILELHVFPGGAITALHQVIQAFNTPQRIPNVNRVSNKVKVHLGQTSVQRTEMRVQQLSKHFTLVRQVLLPKGQSQDASSASELYATQGILRRDSTIPQGPFQVASNVIIRHLYTMITPLIRAQTAIMMIDPNSVQQIMRKAEHGHYITDVEISRQLKRLSACDYSESKTAFQKLFDSHFAKPRYSGNFGINYPLLGLSLAKAPVLQKRLADQLDEETKDDPVIKKIQHQKAPQQQQQKKAQPARKQHNRGQAKDAIVPKLQGPQK